MGSQILKYLIATFVILLLSLAVFFSACEKRENIITKPESIKKINYPQRPNLNPGESNFKNQEPAELSPSITADLTTLTPADLVAALIGSGPDAPIITNITYSGANIAAGTFTGGSDAIGFENGIILSSGNITSIVGPNTSDGISTNNGLPGDSDLDDLIPGYTTHDATILEFDFECTEIQVISFQYVFTSDEYNEYVNSEFNDVFGFFVNGVNIALIPGSTTPVSINNVNCGNPYDPPSGGSYCEDFRNNDLTDGGGDIDTEMDGLTVVFYATANINPGVNHIKLAIADAGDWVLDSDVLIKGESFVCAPPPPEYIEVPIDIKPGSCPNPINVTSNGLLPVAILGTEDFDVSTIDLQTIQLAGIYPLLNALEDVATPYWDSLLNCYSCSTMGMDGYMDLTLKFNKQTFISAIGEVNNGDCIVVELTGNLLPEYGGTMFKGYDIIKIISGKLKLNKKL